MVREYNTSGNVDPGDVQIDTKLDPAYQVYFMIAQLNRLFADYPVKFNAIHVSAIDRLLTVLYILLSGSSYDSDKKYNKPLIDHIAFMTDADIDPDTILSFFDNAMIKFQYIITLCEKKGIWFETSTTADIDEDI